MKKYFPYELTKPAAVEDEQHQIVAGQIRLDHIPIEGTLTIRGFVEATSAANLQTNEFYCNYRRDTLYRESNRIVYFYRGRSGQVVYASYSAAGSPVTADDMNEIKDFMEASTKNFADASTAQTNLKNQFVNLQNETRTALTAHNVNPDAHSDIRDKISAERSERVTADTSLQRQLTNEQTYRRSLELQIQSETVAREGGDAQLQTALNDERTARELADYDLDAKINNLFTVDRKTFLDYVFDGAFTQADIDFIFGDDDDLTGFTQADIDFVFTD